MERHQSSERGRGSTPPSPRGCPALPASSLFWGLPEPLPLHWGQGTASWCHSTFSPGRTLRMVYLLPVLLPLACGSFRKRPPCSHGHRLMLTRGLHSQKGHPAIHPSSHLAAAPPSWGQWSLKPGSADGMLATGHLGAWSSKDLARSLHSPRVLLLREHRVQHRGAPLLQGRCPPTAEVSAAQRLASDSGALSLLLPAWDPPRPLRNLGQHCRPRWTKPEVERAE